MKQWILREKFRMMWRLSWERCRNATKAFFINEGENHAEAEKFNPKYGDNVDDPLLILNMVCRPRIVGDKNNERINIGDYDADGICSSVS